MMTDHVRADGGRAPCCESVAEPEKSIVSPTFHVNDVVGVSMVAVGAETSTLIVIGALIVETLWLSVTRSRATRDPLVGYVMTGIASLESLKLPSPSRSQA